jgi:choline dehydrogenase
VAHDLSGKAALLGALIRSIELCREIGNSAAMRPFVKREVMPCDLTGRALETSARDAASTIHHQTCTAKMGHDDMSVVDGRLQVYGIDNLRVADGSIMPRVTTGNTMAPCVIIGEVAGALLKGRAGLATERTGHADRPPSERTSVPASAADQ